MCVKIFTLFSLSYLYWCSILHQSLSSHEDEAWAMTYVSNGPVLGSNSTVHLLCGAVRLVVSRRLSAYCHNIARIRIYNTTSCELKLTPRQTELKTMQIQFWKQKKKKRFQKFQKRDFLLQKSQNFSNLAFITFFIVIQYTSLGILWEDFSSIKP